VRADDPVRVVAEHVRPVRGEVARLQEPGAPSATRPTPKRAHARRRVVPRPVREEAAPSHPRAEAPAVLGRVVDVARPERVREQRGPQRRARPAPGERARTPCGRAYTHQRRRYRDTLNTSESEYSVTHSVCSRRRFGIVAGANLRPPVSARTVMCNGANARDGRGDLLLERARERVGRGRRARYRGGRHQKRGSGAGSGAVQRRSLSATTSLVHTSMSLAGRILLALGTLTLLHGARCCARYRKG
jgi:hypothetical protein